MDRYRKITTELFPLPFFINDPHPPVLNRSQPTHLYHSINALNDDD